MKSLLVIDQPKSCKECPLFGTSRDFNATIHYCLAYRGKEFLMVIEKGISEKCPLKEMPSKIEPSTIVVGKQGKPYKRSLCEYDEGWNDCINFIGGEE